MVVSAAVERFSLRVALLFLSPHCCIALRVCNERNSLCPLDSGRRRRELNAAARMLVKDSAVHLIASGVRR